MRKLSGKKSHLLFKIIFILANSVAKFQFNVLYNFNCIYLVGLVFSFFHSKSRASAVKVPGHHEGYCQGKSLPVTVTRTRADTVDLLH